MVNPAVVTLPAADELGECGCLNGVLWPMATDGDYSHAWIERCDDCGAHAADDFDAAAALAERLGVAAQIVVHPTLRRPAPYIDPDRWGGRALRRPDRGAQVAPHTRR